MPTDRGAEDKMLEKTELLKLSVTDNGKEEFSSLQLLPSELANKMLGLHCFKLMTPPFLYTQFNLMPL
jgi:hypothetical protein